MQSPIHFHRLSPRDIRVTPASLIRIPRRYTMDLPAISRLWPPERTRGTIRAYVTTKVLECVRRRGSPNVRALIKSECLSKSFLAERLLLVLINQRLRSPVNKEDGSSLIITDRNKSCRRFNNY